MLQIWLCVGLILGLGVGASSDNSIAVDQRSLSLQVDVGKTEFALNEPVVLTYTLQNQSKVPIRTQSFLIYSGGHFKLSIEHSGQVVPFFTGPIMDSGGGEIILDPGSQITESVVMYFNDKMGSMAFPGIGRYAILSELYVGDYPEPVVLRGPRTEIEVVPPSEADVRMIEFLGSEERLKSILRKGVQEFCTDKPHPSCFDELRNAIKTFRDSAYAPHIAFDLGSAVEWGGLKVPEQYNAASAVFSEFLENWPGHALKAEVTVALIYSLLDAGKSEAITRLRVFEKEFPGRARTVEAIEQRIEKGH